MSWSMFGNFFGTEQTEREREKIKRKKKKKKHDETIKRPHSMRGLLKLIFKNYNAFFYQLYRDDMYLHVKSTSLNWISEIMINHD